MMGYTHAIIGAAGGLAAAILLKEGDVSPAIYLTATISGIVGGISVDADVIDQRGVKKVTDGSRSRLAALGILCLGLLIDKSLEIGILSNILSNAENAKRGLVGFFILFLIAHVIGRIVGHRTFSHSLWHIILTTICITLIYPSAGKYYLVGAILHLLFDLLNNQAPNTDGTWHGVWLLYPIKKGEGIALRKCRAFGEGNTALYFIAIILYTSSTIYYIELIGNGERAAAPIMIYIATVVLFHFVRKRSEKELRA